MRQLIILLTLVVLVSCGQKNKSTTSNQTPAMTLDTLVMGNYVLTFHDSDSFPPSDIYGDKDYRYKLKDTIDEYYRYHRAKLIQPYIADRFRDYFYTTASTLVLKLANGRVLRFPKWDAKETIGYTFEHYFDKIDYYLLRVQFNEGNGWMLVNRKNGFKASISGLPYISLDNKQILSVNEDFEDYWFNGLELYSVLADSLRTEFSRMTAFGPADVKWIGENEFLLKRNRRYLDTITGNQGYITDYKRVTIERKPSH